MKFEVDVDIWLDVLPFVPRRQLAKIGAQIGNYQFASILQYFLHGVGQITFGPLHLAAPNEIDEENGPIVILRKIFGEQWGPMETYLPDWPMPGNIRDFQSITLSYFDASVLNFLQQFQEKSLLSYVNLEIVPVYSEESLQQTLAQILPLLDDHINSINIQVIESFEHSHQQILTTLMARTSILSISVWDNTPMDWLCRWLYEPKNGGKPRMLLVTIDQELEIMDRIKKDFEIATYPATFFIRLIPAWDYFHLDGEICLENGQTHEKLVIKKVKWQLLISRHSMKANDKWIEAHEKYILEWEFGQQNRQIGFAQDFDTTSAMSDICGWLYGPEKSGVPRMVLVYTREFTIIDRIKKDFAIAEYPATFFVRLMPRDSYIWKGDISLENGRTNEKLVIKKMKWDILICRYPMEASKDWIEAHEKDVLERKFGEQNLRSGLTYDLVTSSDITDNMTADQPCTSSQM